MKVLKSGEKGFKEEKAKMEDWGIDEVIKNGGVMILNPEEVETLTKEEQLRKIFSKEIRELLQGHETVLVDDVHIPALEFINGLVDKLLYEVKIRVNLK